MQSIPISSDKKSSFVRQTEELTGRLSKIFKDTMHVQEIRLKADGEMIADLYFRIAKSYTNTPEVCYTSTYFLLM